MFAPSTKPRFMRDEAVTREHPPIPVKKPRTEVYQEVRKLPKPVHKYAESKPAANPVKVIEKKPELYTAAVEKPLPQRKVAPRQKPIPIKQEPIKKDCNTATEPVEKAPEQKHVAKEAAAVKEGKAEKEGVIVAEDTKPNVEPNEDGQYELGSAMSSILHDELQQIMIKVWQELPDAPPTEAERFVANKFRNEIGDDFQNAMGLSVTARLLNVHNPLYVKLHFSGKPEAGRLQAFIRDYKITAFKRIGDSLRDTFAARFDRIADFDRFCVHDEVKCGSATVTITPCYKYLSCPPSVKTIYAGNIAKTNTHSSTNLCPQKQANTDKKEKTVESTEAKTVDAKAEDKKVNLETEKSEGKTLVNTTNNKTETTATNSELEAQTVAAKPALDKPKPEIKATKEVSAELKKVTPKIVETKKEVVKKNDVVDKIKNAKECEADINEEMMVVDEMVEEEDDEEMTDQDILALMSGGIVLDECSGSDDEKC